MSNLWEFIKEKSYYFLGATVLLIIVLIVISSCSGGLGSSYTSIENKMVSAAEKYYSTRLNALPKEGSVRVTIQSLVDAGLMDLPKDPNQSSNICSGYVEVTKVESEYSYIPFLTCAGSYEPKFLSEKVKTETIDELGNGVYVIGDSYVYRGETLNNYVMFGERLWRILGVDGNDNIRLILAKREQETVSWDTQYNTAKQEATGVTTNYLITDIRETLKNYYNTFAKDAKAKLVKQDLCVGGYLLTDEFSKEKECSEIQKGEYVGLLNASDYHYASLDTNCKKLEDMSCGNRNYLYSPEVSTWTLNRMADNDYKVIYISSSLYSAIANNYKAINPVISLSSKTIVIDGEGTLEKPYIIK